MPLLALRRDQLDAFVADSRRRLELTQARRLVAEKRVSDEDAALALVHDALERARVHRLVTDQDLADFIDLCATRGVDFADHPAARAALADKQLPGWMRLRNAKEALGVTSVDLTTRG